MFSMQHANHLVFFNNEQSRGCNRARCPYSYRLTCHAPLTKKVTWPQNGDNRLFANFIDNSEFYSARLNVHHGRSGITMRVNDLSLFELFDFSRHPRRIEKGLGIESELLLEF